MSSNGKTKMAESVYAQLGMMSGYILMFHQLVGDVLGMNSTDLKSLDFLRREGSMTAGRLTELTGLTTGAITGIVNRLEERGYVRREKDATDGRRVLIVPVMDKTMREIAPVFASVTKHLKENCARYSITELATILDFLRSHQEIVRQESAALKGKSMVKNDAKGALKPVSALRQRRRNA